ELRSVLARALADEPDEAVAWADRTLWDSERLGLDAVTADALVTKGSILAFRGRPHEGVALLEAGMRLAETRGFGLVAGRAANNLCAALSVEDPRQAVAVGRRGIELARRYGLQGLLVGSLSNAIEAALGVGDWDWIDPELDALQLGDLERADHVGLLVGRAEIDAMRGGATAAFVAELEEARSGLSDPVAIAAVAAAIALIRLAEARFEDAFAEATTAAGDPLNAPQGLRIAARSAVRLLDAERARNALERLAALGAVGTANTAASRAIDGGVLALEGRWGEATVAFRDGWARLRELGLEHELGASMVDFLAVAPPAEPSVDDVAAEAREIFGRIGARAWLAQVEDVLAARSDAASGGAPRGTRRGRPAVPAG
ncbi:MAG TPA: hypothetical protein VGK63_07580, partial [Candidatus Limnocylindrales bacterium]